MYGTFTGIDWLMLLLPTAALLWIGWKVYTRCEGVADFLSGGRQAGRYLLTVADGTAGLGLISIVAMLEQWSKSGLAITFWSSINIPVGMMLALTGFVVYRFRETRAMTLAQFFEMRYSKSFRVFAGALAYTSGIINYALFPAVGGRFLLHYCQMPLEVHLLGLVIPTYGLIMATFLVVALIIVMLGGQVTTMVTDFAQGMFGYFIYAAIGIFILFALNFDQMEAAAAARPPGESFFDPFNTSKLTDFNILYVLINIVGWIYSRQAWQGNQAYYTAAANPHEQKMGGILANWRSGYTLWVATLLTMGAYTVLNHPDFADKAVAIHSELNTRIQLANPQTTETIRTQMLIPVTIRHMLPVGLTGLFCAAMVFLMISTDTTYLHSWGTILVQDVILPLRKKPFAPKRQIWTLRLSILGVAVFAWIFSMFFNQTTYILMFFALTGSIFLGGAGACILGGLYWKKGTAPAAWTAMSLGLVWAVFSFAMEQGWRPKVYPWLSANAPGVLDAFRQVLEGLGKALPIANWNFGPDRFPISPQEMWLINMVLCGSAYVIVSLLTCREDTNMDRLLHRGAYQIRTDATAALAEGERVLPSRLARFLGIDEKFTRGDRMISLSVFWWSMLNFGIFLVILIWNAYFGRWGEHGFFVWFKIWTIGVGFVIAAVTTVWFIWGGMRDLRRYFRGLETEARNVLDDGRVEGHVSTADLAMVEKVERRPNEDAGPHPKEK